MSKKSHDWLDFILALAGLILSTAFMVTSLRFSSLLKDSLWSG